MAWQEFGGGKRKLREGDDMVSEGEEGDASIGASPIGGDSCHVHTTTSDNLSRRGVRRPTHSIPIATELRLSSFYPSVHNVTHNSQFYAHYFALIDADLRGRHSSESRNISQYLYSCGSMPSSAGIARPRTCTPLMPVRDSI